MIYYCISKNRYYYVSCLNVGEHKHWTFLNSPKMAKFYDTKEEAERMLIKIEHYYKGFLDNYKGQFKIRKFELREVK